jgi:hypothetical protein
MDDQQPLDPMTADPRELMQTLLPAARREYVRAWVFLADAAKPLERRRVGRDRAKAIADDHTLVASALRARESSLTGDDLLNASHLAGELERHAAALERIAGISAIGLTEATDLRPEALGCGRNYRDPAKAEAAGVKTRAAAEKPRGGGRGGSGGGGDKRRQDPRRSGGRDDRPRDPKVPKDKLGTSKHDSQLGDDLDEATRAKLEALRQQLEG